MKVFHLSDLHLGKRVNEFSMLEDQKYILAQITDLAQSERPDAVIIAGDVYDKSVPPAEAVELFDRFLVGLSALGLQVLVISGNHDSAERLAFGGRLMDQSGVHFAPVYNGSVASVTLQDAYGPVTFWLLPFLKPAHVRRFFPEAEIESYTDAIRTALSAVEFAPGHRNVLVTHQFVTGASRCESEEISVGGSDNVDASVLEGFDYVALGHIHGPQQAGGPAIRYCGTPLKYSFSEISHQKSVTVVELTQEVSLRTLPLLPLRDMKELKGTYEELTLKSYYDGQPWKNDYLRVILTDEEDIPEAMGRLRAIYPNIMRLEYDNRRTRSMTQVGSAQQVESLSPLELFDQLYTKQNDRPMSDQQREFAQNLIESIWEGKL
ncbi:MAG: exonuclease SbcCD subunit D [Oscillospiraceae bacterium]|nr:exonuclease SbcCD subunit D [Oscillospiraceae bacterium]